MRTLLLSLLVLLFACGQKGQLYLPGPSAESMPAPLPGEESEQESGTKQDNDAALPTDPILSEGEEPGKDRKE